MSVRYIAADGHQCVKEINQKWTFIGPRGDKMHCTADCSALHTMYLYRNFRFCTVLWYNKPNKYSVVCCIEYTLDDMLRMCQVGSVTSKVKSMCTAYRSIGDSSRMYLCSEFSNDLNSAIV